MVTYEISYVGPNFIPSLAFIQHRLSIICSALFVYISLKNFICFNITRCHLPSTLLRLWDWFLSSAWLYFYLMVQLQTCKAWVPTPEYQFSSYKLPRIISIIIRVHMYIFSHSVTDIKFQAKCIIISKKKMAIKSKYNNCK